MTWRRLRDFWGWLSWRCCNRWGNRVGWAEYRDFAVRWRAAWEASKGKPLTVLTDLPSTGRAQSSVGKVG